MNTDYLIFLCIYLGGLIIRTGYELLKKGGRINPKNKMIFAIVFIAMCMLWGSWFSLCPLDPFHLNVPDIVRWLGFFIFLIGLVLAIGSFIQLRGLENINHLVTTGLYSKLRHPMYTGFILWIFGWAVYHGATGSLVIGLIGIGNILYWRRVEDEYMITRYGQDYQNYRRGTWF